MSAETKYELEWERIVQPGDFVRLVAVSSQLKVAAAVGDPFWVLLASKSDDRVYCTTVDVVAMLRDERAPSLRDLSMRRLYANYGMLEFDNSLRSISGSVLDKPNADYIAYAKGRRNIRSTC